MVTRMKTGFKTSACYSWTLPSKCKLSNSWEEEKLSGLKRLCLTDHVLEFSTTSTQRRQWHPMPVFLPGESQGRGSLVGCRLWGRTESDTMKQLSSSSSSTQKELSQLRKHLNGYKRKLWDWIMLRTKQPYQERLITGGLVLVSSQEGWRNEWTWDAEPSHIPSQSPSPLCLLLIPSLSSLIKRGR